MLDVGGRCLHGCCGGGYLLRAVAVQRGVSHPATLGSHPNLTQAFELGRWCVCLLPREPCPVYNLEAGTTMIMNPSPEDIAQPYCDLQMEVTPCSEEPRTPIVSGCVAAEDVASYECRIKTFTVEVRRPIHSPPPSARR